MRLSEQPSTRSVSTHTSEHLKLASTSDLTPTLHLACRAHSAHPSWLTPYNSPRTRLLHASVPDVNVLYLFEAKPPFGVVRVSVPFTLPSCVHGRLHMLIQVAKSLVEVDGGYLLCWGELDCYSCCATLPRSMVERMLDYAPA